jgi:hypothetical protein
VLAKIRTVISTKKTQEQISLNHTFVNIPALISKRSVFKVVGPGYLRKCYKGIWTRKFIASLIDDDAFRL